MTEQIAQHTSPVTHAAPSPVGALVELVDVPYQHRWILQRYRGLVGMPQDAAVTLDEITSLTTPDLAAVKGVGPVRAQRAIEALRALVHLGPANDGPCPSPTPSAGHSAICGEEVVLDTVDPRYRWILERLLQHEPSQARRTVQRSLVEALTAADFMRVAGVGPIRAERTCQYFGALLGSASAQTSPVPPPERFLKILPSSDDLNPLVRDAVGHVKVPLRLFPGPLRFALHGPDATADDQQVSVGQVIALTEPFLSSHGGFTADEARDLISLRDDLLNITAVRKCAAAHQHRDIVLVTALVQMAIQAKWSFVEWANETGIAADRLLNLIDAARTFIGPPLDARVGVYFVDLTVARRVLDGESLEQVGKAFGVTRERIRQRIGRVGITGRLARDAQRRARDASERRYQPLVDSYVREHPGCFYYEITDATGCPIDLTEQLARPVRWLVLDAADDQDAPEYSLPSVLETRCRSVAALQRAATFCFPLSSKGYAKLLREKYVEGPSAVRIIQVFGTWRSACDAAGVESGHTGTYPGHSAVWSFDDVLHSVCKFLLAPECTGACIQYEEWRAHNNTAADLPSFGTVKKTLGHSWPSIRRRALMRLRQQWADREFT